MTEALVGTELVERHGVELAFVQVGHRPLALLLAQRAGGVQRVLEAVTADTDAHAATRSAVTGPDRGTATTLQHSSLGRLTAFLWHLLDY